MLLVFVGFAFAHASERDGTVRASSNTALFESLFILSTRRVDWSRSIRSEFSLAWVKDLAPHLRLKLYYPVHCQLIVIVV